MFSKLYKKIPLFLVIIFILFLVLRIPGLDLPYHEDERVWPGLGSAGLEGLGGFVHPPFTNLVFIAAVSTFGEDHLRYLPFLFGIINFWLLFALVKRRFSTKAAFWSSLFFSAGFFSVLASLMIDTDGQVLPFFFLLSATSYFKWRESVNLKNKFIWGGVLAVSIFLGSLTKVSFIIASSAFVLDFLYSQKHSLSRQKLSKIVLIVAGLFALLFLLILGIMYVLPNANVSRPLSYWKHFVVFSGRNYLQISIQFFKALLYSSPLLLLPLLFLTRDLARKLRLFIIFLFLGLTFYLVLFDFSSGALDRYFQFMIVPLSIISGVVVSNIFEGSGVYNKRRAIVFGCAIGSALFFLQFLPHFVPALYPKTEWFNRILSLKWDFLFPFIGGSGPMGFYVSWLFMALIWLITAVLAIAAFKNLNWRKQFWIVIIILGLLYNGIFVEEYLFGKINGSPAVVLKNAVEFIKNNPDIKRVITYNNIGYRELLKIGKYERRLYAAPKFESSYTDILKNFKNHYLIIEIPRLHSDSPYVKYFSSCKTVYEEFSGKIPARIYDCRNAVNM
ncbi:MAG: glycosyltransferase family 39 protein [Candidatus Yanofskybacteria bacterium]|nr:glycosyltransferase family 39 protein [Candidatus Yanofskybacteria bacterium]